MSYMNLFIDTRKRGNFGIGIWIEQIVKNFNGEFSELEIKGSPTSIFDFIRLSIFVPKKIVFLTFFHSFPAFKNSVKSFIFIHDLIWLDLWVHTGLTKRFYFYCYYKILLCRASKIFVVSNFTYKRVMYYFPEIENKLQIIIPGNDHLPIKNLISNNKNRKNLLSVINEKSYKRLDYLIESYLELKKLDSEFSLTIVGVHNSYSKRYDYCEIIFLYNIANEELSEQYLNASIIIAPSLYEGYGLPTLEAMHYNKKILATDIEVNREVSLDYPNIYFLKSFSPYQTALQIIELSNFVIHDFKIKIRYWSDVSNELKNILEYECSK